MTIDAKRTLFCATTILGLAMPASAFAQDAAGGAVQAPAEASTANPEGDIIVTARRRAERQQDVPVAVSVLDNAQLERAGVNDVNALQGKVPNLLIVPAQGSGSSTPTFAIRGLSQQDITHLSDPSVSLYVNDIVLPRPNGGKLAFFDIANIQVLRGPQGTLFGRNTPGGAIVVTPQAPTDEFEGSVSGSLANYGVYSVEGMLNVPLGDQASIRVAGIHSAGDGYIFDVITGKGINTVNEDAVRVGFDLHPNSSFTSLTTVNYAKATNGGSGAFARPGSIGGADQLTRDIYHTASGVPQFSNVETFSVDNHTTIDLDDNITIRNIAGYREMNNNTLEDVDGTSNFVVTIQRLTEQRQYSEELQLLGDHGWVNWIVGGYFFREEGDDQALSAGQFGGGGVDPGLIEPNRDLRLYPIYNNTWSTAENTSKAVFAQATFKLDSLIPGLSFTAGGRMNWDRREAVIKNRSASACRFTVDNDQNPATPEVNPGLVGCSLPLAANFSEPTYNFSLDYHVSKDVLIYLATRHGYRTGGFGARATTEEGLSRTYLPETVDDYELGVKADWHVGGMFLRTNVALFYADYTDIQRLLRDVTLNVVTTVTANAGSAKIKGAEFEALFRPTPWLEMSGFWSITDAKFKDFRNPFDGTDLSQAPFARAPRNIVGAQVKIDLPTPASIGEATLSASYYHQDRYSANDNFIPGVSYQQPYDLVNATAELKNAFGTNADVSFFVNNLFDKEYSNSVQLIAANSVNSAVAGAPRTYGVRLKYRFGQ